MPGFNLYEALSSCAHHFESFGGHAAAAGLKIEEGKIDGLDVAGLTYAILLYIPDNALSGNWRVVAFVDDKATADQEKAILSVYTGEKGGPVADLARLIGDVVAVERAGAP